MILRETGLFLLDPGYLIHEPIRLPTTVPSSIDTCFNTLELHPRDAGHQIDLITVVKNDRRLRLTYKMNVVDGSAFGQAWKRPFAWEVMTYPVLTRCARGVHLYLQGNVLRIRDNKRTIKRVLSLDEQCGFITRILGIDERIVKKAISVVSHGRVSSSIPC